MADKRTVCIVFQLDDGRLNPEADYAEDEFTAELKDGLENNLMLTEDECDTVVVTYS